jgi:phosphomannomutase
VNSHQILSLLAKYLHQEKGMSGDIVKTFSATDMLNRQADKYGLNIHVKPIGFKYVAELIVNGDVLVGGEESGGLSVKGHIPERDGLYIGLLITEMMVKSGKKLSELVKELNDEFGVHATYREDMHTTDHRKNSMMSLCKEKGFTEIAGQKVVEWDMLDGVKHLFEDGSWLLVRPSGTEPVLRIYSEARSEEAAVALVKSAVEKVNSF